MAPPQPRAPQNEESNLSPVSDGPPQYDPVPSGTLATLCALFGVLVALVIGGAIVRRMRRQHRRAEQVRRTQLMTERDIARLQRFSVASSSYYSAESKQSLAVTEDDMPLSAVQRKFSIAKPHEAATAPATFFITIQSPEKVPSSPPRRTSVPDSLLQTPPRIRDWPIPPTPMGSPASTTSASKRFSFAQSVKSAASWSQVARTLLEPSRSASSLGSPRSAKFDLSKMPVTPKPASKRGSRASSTMWPSPGLSVLLRGSGSDLMLTHGALPPPALCVTVPTMASLSEQARADYTMEQQILGVMWDESESLASGEVEHEPALDVVVWVDECDVVDSLRVPVVY